MFSVILALCYSSSLFANTGMTLITARYFNVGNLLLKNLTQVNNNNFCLMVDKIGLMLDFVK